MVILGKKMVRPRFVGMFFLLFSMFVTATVSAEEKAISEAQTIDSKPASTLSQDVESAAIKLHEELKAQMVSLHSEKEAAEIALEKLLKQAEPNKETVLALTQELGKIRGKIALARIDFKEKLRTAGVPEGWHHKWRNGEMKEFYGDCKGCLDEDCASSVQDKKTSKGKKKKKKTSADGDAKKKKTSKGKSSKKDNE